LDVYDIPIAPATLTSKIVASHAVGRGEDDLEISVDQVLIEDVTGTMACLQFERLGLDRVQTPLAVSYVDHNVLQIDERNPDDHVYLRTFAERYGMLLPAGQRDLALHPPRALRVPGRRARGRR
jgi:aconitate hydratase